MIHINRVFSRFTGMQSVEYIIRRYYVKKTEDKG